MRPEIRFVKWFPHILFLKKGVENYGRFVRAQILAGWVVASCGLMIFRGSEIAPRKSNAASS